MKTSGEWSEYWSHKSKMTMGEWIEKIQKDSLESAADIAFEYVSAINNPTNARYLASKIKDLILLENKNG